MPLIAPEKRFAVPSVVARHELAKLSGSCGSTRTVKAVQKVPASSDGKEIDDGPKATSDPARTSITITPVATSTSEIGCRRSASATSTSATASGIAQAGGDAKCPKLL